MSIFHTTRSYAVPPAGVFAAIVDPVRLAMWWGPAGFTNTFAVCDVRAGGAWEFTMHGPDGTDYPNVNRFLEVVPNTLVRIQHVNLPHFELAITLEPSGTGTLLTWHAVFADQEFAEKLRGFLESANEQNLDRLAVQLAHPG
jgi:uncharacterized protein YndB with AHSA1/START domain